MARRSDPVGAVVQFEAESATPIAGFSFALEGSGTPPVTILTPPVEGFDGRYVRQFGIKATVNGTWPLVVSAWDTAGHTGVTRCAQGITVTF